MQHSPQEIKTRLGQAVDPEGNVLNMAAVVEVIGLLERTPLTKEALEQTRIGRTVNLLRKKTENEDIARRAKKLVKKWQKLVQNHLEAVRNPNSPNLNGLRCSSPIVNGTIRDEEKPVEGIKAKLVDQKNKGIKRKRTSVDTPPPGGGGSEDISGRDKKEKDVVKEKKVEINLTQENKLVSTPNILDLEERQKTANEKNVPLDSDPNDKTNLTKRMKRLDKDETVCSNVQEQSEDVDLQNISNAPVSLDNEKTTTLDHNDVRWEGKDFSQQTEDLIEPESTENKQDLSVLPLDIEDKADGINGRVGEDGAWYSWSQSMPSNGGNLIILPYVLLE